MTHELHKVLTKVILAKQAFDRIYYILVTMTDGYRGPTATRHNHLLNSGVGGERTIDLSGKTVVHNKLILLDNPPPVPLVNSSLWRIDNKAGGARCVYILPPDKPIMMGVEMGEASEFIWKSAKNAPLIWSTN